MRTLAVLLAVLAASPALALAPGPGEGAPERVVVRLADVGGDLDAVLAEAGATLLLRDDVLGFAAIETADPARLARALGAPVIADPVGGAAVDAIVADAPLDPYFVEQWGPIELNMPQAWAVQDGSTSVLVAIVDSGMNFAHPDLVAVPVVKGHDYIDGDENPVDQNGHGSHVAGVVAATRDNAAGIAGMARVKLLVVRVLDAGNSGYCSAFAAGVREAADKGARIINLSLYCSVHWPDLQAAIQYATGKGALVVAAAGNFQSSNPSACVTYPARYAEAMAVAALEPTLQAASYSCRGPEVEIAAPGSNVYSTVLGSAYALYSGTSMATPHVAGAAALLASQHPTWTGAQIRAHLDATARDLGTTPGRDVNTGWGLVNPVKALSGDDPVYVPFA